MTLENARTSSSRRRAAARCRRPEERGAAFFDLDRTLMAGSSAYQFGRAAYKAGLISRRRLAADTWANVRFRLRGSTDAATEAIKDADLRAARGRAACATCSASRPTCSPGVLPRLYPQMLEIAYEHQDAGRPVFICTAASQEMAELMATSSRSTARSARVRGRRRGLHGPRRRAVHLPRGQGAGDPRAGRARGHRPGGVVGVLGLRVRPADAARRRPSRRRQPRHRARAGRARRGLGGPALRAARRGALRVGARARPRSAASARSRCRGRAREPARADRRAAGDPRARAAVRRREDRAARRRVGPRPPLPARAVRASSASSG